MMLTIFTDFKSPAAYLAMKSTLSLIKDHELAVTWLPFPTKQSALPPKQTDENKGETHRRVRAEQRQQIHIMYAELTNTPMHFPLQPGNSDLALNVLANLKVDPVQFINQAYTAYWVEGQDLNDAKVVEQLVKAAGLSFSPDLLQPAALEAGIEQAQAQGIFDVPAFVMDEQVFIGREHMPWLRELAIRAST
jgi:2-hydroxychromene-2-carboxylate isomerase